ncbi:DNA primase [Brevibacillus sp. SYP-B805]|uniref:DnaB-like helicase C-terminal domain-containing protein n=1 Tax=Brevibacillus sp. SYP-B805 TaxID=1578199 RepID=UPI0013EC7751|nr:DnaB-like helicase C-terminal domain-containing protein [Brevibacillus sp. SYP-B805]NGQ94605.1 DNA primase [Brevibacillus sp. SYP-B805]
MGEHHFDEHQGVAKRFSWEDLDELVGHYEKQMTPEALEYLLSRGIDADTVEQFRLGFERPQIGFHAGKGMLGGFFQNCIIFPIVDEHGKVMDLVGRTIDNRQPKYRSLLGRTDLFFNQPVIGIAQDIILVRNVFDVLSLAQAKLPAVALPEFSPFREQHAQALAGKRVFISYPNDDAGRRESVRVASLLENVATEAYIVHLPEGLRDVNDLFVRAQDPLDLYMNLLNEAVSENLKMPVFPDARSVTVFTEEYAKRQKGLVGGISSGFPDLDNKLVGGLTTGLYLLMGSVSSGKSMFLRQMADQIAGQGVPVVYVSWEMTAYKLWCRSMARMLQVPPRDVLAGRIEPEKINAAAQQYAETAKHMWTIEGTLDVTLQEVGATISRIIQSIGKIPVIFVDDLFRIALRDGSGSLIHGNPALAAYHLHQWSRQWDTPVITAASVQQPGSVEMLPLVEAAVDTIIRYEAVPCQAYPGEQMDEITLSLVKNRNGTLGAVQLLFDKEKAQFLSSHP